MNGEINKRHNKKIKKHCPVCGGKVIVAHRNDKWWVACDEDRYHIPQKFYQEPIDAIRAWNSITNADRIRNMTDLELANWLIMTHVCTARFKDEWCKGTRNCQACWLEWLKQESDGE